MKHGQRYKVTFEGEFEESSFKTLDKFRVNGDPQAYVCLRRDEYTAYETEPPIGSVTLDKEGIAWQRCDDGSWRAAGPDSYTRWSMSWEYLNKSGRGPTAVVYRAEERAD